MEITVNYIALFLAGVASMAVGYLWYSPVLFGKQWMKMSGLTEAKLEEAKKDMPKTYFSSYLLSIVMAYVLTHVMTMSMSYFGYSALQTGLTSAFWMWLGFVMPVQATAVLYGENKNWTLFAINTGYQLVGLLAMGAVLGWMK